MLIIKIICLILLFLSVYYSIGKLITNHFSYLKGFELVIGMFITFGLFHVISVIPTILNAPVQMIYYITYPLLGLFIILSYTFSYKNFIFHKEINYFLLTSIIIFIGIYFLFDFIIPGDSSFYLPLIRSVTTQKNIYMIEPWSGITSQMGYMYYFVTYELFIGTLSHLFRMDSTIFTVNVVTFCHLVIILITSYTFLKKIIKDKVKTNYAFLIYLFVFIFLNSNLHRVFFTHNAFNFITNSYTGKTIYLNGLVILLFYLLNRIVSYQNKRDILFLGLFNLITPGLTASALFLQLIMSLVVIIYFIIYQKRQTDRFYGFIILTLLIPIIINYQFIIFASDFYLKSTLFIIGIESLFIVIILIGLFLYYYGNEVINKNQKVIKNIFYGCLILIGVASISGGIYLLATRSNDIYNSVALLPNPLEIIYLYGYNLVIFYILAILGLIYVHKKYPNFQFLFYSYVLIMLLVFLNPFNFPLVGGLITSFRTFHRILFILPIHFMIVLYFVNIKNKKKLLIWLFVIIIPFISIFHGLHPINNSNFYYKVKNDVVDIGHKLDKPYRIIAEEDFINELSMVTNNYEFVFTVNDMRQVEYKAYDNEELLELILMINNKNQFMAHTFTSLVKKYHIECIIVYKNNPINSNLQKYYHQSESLSTESIIVYLIQ
ncbi:hypothetical protein KHQ81_09555 [Mycoplasmatota bacterium]|nr:hypothetical protein KHQ81_09555 [Mycoplasmatota bacterium]